MLQRSVVLKPSASGSFDGSPTIVSPKLFSIIFLVTNMIIFENDGRIFSYNVKS